MNLNDLHGDAYQEALAKEKEAVELKERQVKALEEIACVAEFLGYLTDEVKKLRIAIELKNS